MKTSIIVAIGNNNEIGKGNEMLWHLPADLLHFKETTSGHPVIMGRKTFESIGRPLPNRQNIVITRNNDYKRDGVKICSSLDEALKIFKDSDKEVFIIGGGEIYRQAMSIADKLYVTKVDGDFDADTFFPEINDEEWGKVSEEAHEPDDKNHYPYKFIEYKKTTL